MRGFRQTWLVTCALLAAMPLYAQDLQSGGILTIETPSLSSNQSLRQDFRITQSGGKTLSQAVEQVRRQYNGRIVSAETKRSGNREVHHIKVLTEGGKVKTVRVQGRSLDKKG